MSYIYIGAHQTHTFNILVTRARARSFALTLHPALDAHKDIERERENKTGSVTHPRARIPPPPLLLLLGALHQHIATRRRPLHFSFILIVADLLPQ